MGRMNGVDSTVIQIQHTQSEAQPFQEACLKEPMFAGGELSPKAPTEGTYEGGTASGERRPPGSAAWERRSPWRRWQACVPLADGTLLRTRDDGRITSEGGAGSRGGAAADMPRRDTSSAVGAVASAGLLQCGEAEGSRQGSRVREYIIYSRYLEVLLLFGCGGCCAPLVQRWSSSDRACFTRRTRWHSLLAVRLPPEQPQINPPRQAECSWETSRCVARLSRKLWHKRSARHDYSSISLWSLYSLYLINTTPGRVL
jgi:hypothetical protein